MRVVCKTNKLQDLPNKHTRDRIKKYLLSDGVIYLDIGKEYTVYGIVFQENHPFYYICEREDDTLHPTPKPAEFFEIVDDRLSSYWKLSVDQVNDLDPPELVFKEWAEDCVFYARLLKRDPKAEAIFNKYRQLMDQEALS